MLKEFIKGQVRHVISGFGYASMGYLAAKGLSADQMMNIYEAIQFIGSLIVVFGAQGASALNAKEKEKLKNLDAQVKSRGALDKKSNRYNN